MGNLTPALVKVHPVNLFTVVKCVRAWEQLVVVQLKSPPTSHAAKVVVDAPTTTAVNFELTPVVTSVKLHVTWLFDGLTLMEPDIMFPWLMANGNDPDPETLSLPRKTNPATSEGEEPPWPHDSCVYSETPLLAVSNSTFWLRA